MFDKFQLYFLLRSNITEWDIAETKGKGPFAEILEYDIFVNCILLNEVLFIKRFIKIYKGHKVMWAKGGISDKIFPPSALYPGYAQLTPLTVFCPKEGVHSQRQ